MQSSLRGTYSALVSSLESRRDECLSDGAHLARLLTAYVAGLPSSLAIILNRALMSAAAATDHAPLRLALLKLVQQLPSAPIFRPASALLSRLLCDHAAGPADAEDAAIDLLMSRLSPEALNTPEDAVAAVNVLLLALASSAPDTALAALGRVGPDLFTALGRGAEQGRLIEALLDVALAPPTSEIGDAATRALRTLPLSASVFHPLLLTKSRGTTEPLVTGRLSAVLELLSAMDEALLDGHLLLQPLSNLLKALLERGGHVDAVETLKQQLITVMAERVRHSSASHVQASGLDLDILVSCVRVDPSAALSPVVLQTRRAALSLLALLAPLLPDAISAVLLQLFTHLAALPISESTDGLSLSLMETTATAILPALFPAQPPSSSALSPLAWSFVSTLIRSAVLTASSAGLYLQLWTSIVKTLSPLYLPGVLCLLLLKGQRDDAAHLVLMEKRAKRREEKQRKRGAAPLGPTTAHFRDDRFDYAAFVHVLLDRFSPQEQQINALVGALTLLPASKALDVVLAKEDGVSSEEERGAWYNAVVQLVSEHLVHLPFVSALMELPPEESAALQRSYLALFEQLLAHQQSSSPSADSSGAVQSGLSSAISRLTHLLSVGDFVSLTTELLARPSAAVLEQTLRLLQAKLSWVAAHHSDRAMLSSADTHFTVEKDIENERDALTGLFQPLSGLLSLDRGPREGQLSSKERLAVVQLSLSCLQSLVVCVCGRLPFAHGSASSALSATKLGQRRRALLDVFPLVQALSRHTSAPLAASALLTASSLIDQLELAALSLLPTFLPVVLDLATSASSASTSAQSAVALAALTVASSCIDHLSSFLSPFLPSLLSTFMQPTFHSGSKHEARAIIDSSTASLVRRLSPSTLLPALSFAFKAALVLGARSLSFLISVMSLFVQRLTAEEVRMHVKPLFAWYVQHALTVRLQSAGRLSTEEVDRVEDEAVASLMALVLKMNEQQLKTCFLRALDAFGATEVAVFGPAAGAGKAEPAANDAERVSRAVVLLKVVQSLAERLQSIFAPYSLLCFDHAVALLTPPSNRSAEKRGPKPRGDDDESDAEDSDEDEAAEDAAVESFTSPATYSQLVALVFSSLRLCLLHDAGHAYGKEQLDRLIPALQAQLQAPASWSASFVSSSLIPLCSQLALTLSHFHLWKALHGALLSASSSRSAAVRLAVVRCVRAMFEAVGSRYLVLLPETLPVLAEWLEDEDVDVEREVQLLVKTIEGQSGESLDKYLEG